MGLIKQVISERRQAISDTQLTNLESIQKQLEAGEFLIKRADVKKIRQFRSQLFVL